MDERESPAQETITEGSIDPGDRAQALLEGLLATMGLTADIAVSVQAASEPAAGARPLVLEISGTDLGVLIGWRGETLRALQSVLNLMLGDDDRLSRRVIVDVEGYRARREVHAAELAQRAAERVKSSGQRQMLDPMGGYERRAIHMALQGDPDVRTESMGKEPARRVVIHPRGAGGQPTG